MRGKRGEGEEEEERRRRRGGGGGEEQVDEGEEGEGGGEWTGQGGKIEGSVCLSVCYKTLPYGVQDSF